MKSPQTAIVPQRHVNFPEWFQQVVKLAELAEASPVRGCMVIRPWGYGIWENIQKILDARFKETGHKNAYFPLFIPKSFLEKEAEHVDGFAKECAVVTHHRLEDDGKGSLVPAGKLQEPLIVRPTSETIVGAMFSKWVSSYRDLPLLINQWANVVRWEMRTRLFLRTTEFLWQEGHTVHATEEEAQQETRQMLELYADFLENTLAIPVIKGEKSPLEKFPGAVTTYTVEAMMQDRKALQAGTSHFLGQNFSKASDIKYLNDQGEEVYAWTTSWGVSTRMIGALIMAHSDDNGLILPPKIAPAHVVIIPVAPKPQHRESVMEYCHKLRDQLKAVQFCGRPVEVELDDGQANAGEKSWNWIKKGIPLRLEVGPRDIAKDKVFMGRRDKGPKEKVSLSREDFIEGLPALLQDIQDQLLSKALEFREKNTVKIDTMEQLEKFFTPKNPQQPEIHAGFALCHWSGDDGDEEQMKRKLGITLRCIPCESEEEHGKCILTGKDSSRRVVWAKSY